MKNPFPVSGRGFCLYLTLPKHATMNENILYDTPKPVEMAPKRPTFLTVLCILTFVGSAIALLMSVYGYFTAERSAAMFDTSMGNMQEADHLGMIAQTQLATQKEAENALPILIIGIITSLLCLFGAMQMWKQLKRGFYIYCVGEIIAPVSKLFLGAGTMIELAGMGLGLLVAMAFIIMYAVNLKHMK